MAKQVKTWRVLRDDMKVGDDVRNFGDLMPEAGNFANLRVYLSSGMLEEIWVDESVVEEFMKGRKKTKAPKKDSTEENSNKSEEGEGKTVKTTKKRTAPRKRVTKKPTGKKAGNVLEERSV